LGFLVAGAVTAAIITVIANAWRSGLHSVLSFWIIYVLTRPLGASIGDFLSQPSGEGGLGLGATLTSLLFLAAIIGAVVYLAITKADVIKSGPDEPGEPAQETEGGGFWQTVTVVGSLIVLGLAGYLWQTSVLQEDVPVAAASGGTPQAGALAVAGAARPTTASRLGDLSSFRAIAQSALQSVDNGDQAGATVGARDLETAWDDAEARLKPRDKAGWTTLDGKVDKVLREIRATTPDPSGEKAALGTLIDALT
ncbi:MAG: hypothetical protein JOY78_11250, partial [Pseudonocardia sp.]|nr:hypothetical protein [Pseudonocardia sp.]